MQLTISIVINWYHSTSIYWQPQLGGCFNCNCYFMLANSNLFNVWAICCFSI